MSFIWTRKIAASQLQTQVQPQAQPQVQNTVQEVELPIYQPDQDKISDIEHKNGKCLVSSREENNAFGSIEEEINGEEVVLPCVKDSEVVLQEGWPQGEEDSSSFASLKN
jgi:hypothetical protein